MLSLYIKCGKVSVTLGVASSDANDVIMRIAGLVTGRVVNIEVLPVLQ